MEKKIILGILGVVVLAILAVAIVPQAIGMFGLEGTKEKYKIGVILPATGYFADYGKAALNGIEMAKQDFSNIELLVEDDAGENQQAATAAKKLSGIENVNALITFRSSISSTVAPIAEESKTPLIYSSTIIDPAKKNEYAFQNYANLREDCKELTKITEKIALIGHNLDSTIACIQGIESNKKQVTYELITKENNDYKTQLIKIMQANPDYLVIRGDDKATPLILKQAQELGFKGFKVICPNIYGSGCTTKQAIEEYKEYFTNATGSDAYLKETTALTEYSKKYEQKFGTKPSEWSFAVYEDIKILSEALSACKGEKECVKNYLLNTEFDGLEGKLKFNSLGVVEKPTNIVEFDGKEWVKAN